MATNQPVSCQCGQRLRRWRVARDGQMISFSHCDACGWHDAQPALRADGEASDLRRRDRWRSLRRFA